MRKKIVGLAILCLTPQVFAAKPLVEFVSTPNAIQTLPQNNTYLYYTLQNNTKINLPLSYRFSSLQAFVAPELSTCTGNILPAGGRCTIAVSYQTSFSEQLITKIYYQGRGPLVNNVSITVDNSIACSLLHAADWQSSFCQQQYQSALTNSANTFNTSNQNVQQEQTLGGIFGIYQKNTIGEKICYISCGQKQLNGTAPDENTLFELASVSKLFTTSVLGTAVVSGRVNPLAPIAPNLPTNDWLGQNYQLSNNEQAVTYQQLATFSGGVCFSDAPDVDNTSMDQPLNQSNFVKDINQLNTESASCLYGQPQVKLAYGVPNYLPSHNFYSNSSIGLLAQGLMAMDGYSNVLEGDFNDWICANITRTLNMPMTSGCLPEEANNGTCPSVTTPNSNVSSCNTSAWQSGQYAAGYHINNASYQLGVPFKYLPWAGAGGIRSNAHDMINFIRANLNISTNTDLAQLNLLQGMQLAHQANNYLPTPTGDITKANIGSQFPLVGGQGYAWVCDTIKGIAICGKIGGHENFRSFVGISPQQQYGLVILFNTGANSTNGSFKTLNYATPTISTIGVNMILDSAK